ncbi:MAG: hypothetical protein ABIO35_10885 [Nitrobacter sp.]
MPRIANVRERRHQPFWDTLIKTTGNPTPLLQNTTNLFGNSNVGNLALTNLQVAGQLASDQTYVILALRAYLYFNGTNRRANYLRVNSQLYWTLIVGEKPMFQAPCWYFPAGGGTWGFDATTSVFNNGLPTQEAILKLARPIIVPVRQNFAVTASFYPMGTVIALDGLNAGATDDEKEIKFVLDGLQTRDVQ